MKKILLILSVLLMATNVFSQVGPEKIIISEIMYDTPLNEKVTTIIPYCNGEYIELYNPSPDFVDISGWKLDLSRMSMKFEIPAGTVIRPCEFVILMFQCKNSGFQFLDLFTWVDSGAVEWGIVYQERVILWNEGGTLKLYDGDGKLRDIVTYDGTSNQSNPNRLYAQNEDGTPGMECVSLQRINLESLETVDAPVFDPLQWVCATVTPFGVTKPAEVIIKPELNLNHPNYVRTRTYTESHKINYRDRIDYFDGLGFLQETVDNQFTPSGGDRVSLCEYNGTGDVVRNWIPAVYTENRGEYMDPAALKRKQYSDLGDDCAYTEIRYESLASRRKTKAFMPGRFFLEEDLMKTHRYDTNSEDEVRWLKIDSATTALTVAGGYPAQNLYKTTVTDEDGRPVITYVDKRGLTILIRCLDEENEFADTYYVYDDMDRLRWVVTPKGSELIRSNEVYPYQSEFAKVHCYLYWYDGRGNVSIKRQPGRSYEYMEYDAANRLHKYLGGHKAPFNLSEPGPVPPGPPKELVTYDVYDYDKLGRVIRQTGQSKYMINPGMRVTLRALYRYGKSLYPLSDSDGSLVPFEVPSALAFKPVEGIVTDADVDNRNTVEKIYEKLAVLDQDTSSYVERAFYYDENGRVIQVVEKNHLGGICRYSTKYNFESRKTIYAESVQSDPQAGRIEKKTTYSYDLYGRLLVEETSINDALQAKMNYGYDGQGRLVAQTYGRQSPVIVDSLRYSLQNWLAGRSFKKGDQNIFRMELRRCFPKNVATRPCYAGNISEWEWQFGSDTKKTYAFSYDRLGRLTNSEYYEGDSETSVNANSEKGITYDKNGNILSMQRYGVSSTAPAGNYDFSYKGNQLTVVNANDDYSYDYDGNLSSDGWKGLNYSYNFLNLPWEVRSGATQAVLAEYSYLADGTKLGVIGADSTGYEYIGSLIFKRTAGQLSFESTPFSGGQVVASQTQDGVRYAPLFFLIDHLGSVRVIADERGDVKERFEYYPFGSRWSDAGQAVTDNRFLFNGKEMQVVGDLGILDYGTRMYDADFGRWLTQDFVAEQFYATTPYGYVRNNPISRTDFMGLWDEEPEPQRTVNIEPVEIVGKAPQKRPSFAEDMGDMAVDMLPMVSFNRAAGEAVSQGKYGKYAINLLLGSIDGALAFVPGSALVKGALRGAEKQFLKFTARNFRKNLARMTGEMPVGKQAHHTLPQEFYPNFNRAGLNINDPKFGVWMDQKAHLKGAYDYNLKWSDYFEKHSAPTSEEILKKADEFMSNYKIK